MAGEYIVGIDLGTTHCALAFVRPDPGAAAKVEVFEIGQLVRPGEVAARPLLPSCVYLPAGQELPAEALALPWGSSAAEVVGELARWQGARVPGRLISSAKSWLCHPQVDRQAPILPWGAPAGVPKLSPVEASARLLSHLSAAWDQGHPGAPLCDQEVVVTVPASFDEAARALTVSAAQRAGLARFTLLEEPQAALYDFTALHRADLAAALAGVRLVLVVDVGGGTTDLTLVWVEALPEGPALKRLAVGDHLMLGGDNMDAALARRAEEKLRAAGHRLSAGQWAQLVHGARAAKEALLGASPPPSHGLSLVAEGSRLLGGALSTSLLREEAEQTVLDGFFPRIPAEEAPRKAGRMALHELGLPYAQEAAVTRHVLAFLRQHAAAGFTALGQASPAAGALPRPDALLLNGGVFNSPQITRRLLEVLSSWWPEAPPVALLRHGSLDLAVARGAAYYGLTRRGLGRKIGGGAARAYYVGLGAQQGTPRAVCLLPRGFEEGQSVELTEQGFRLALGRPVQFPLYSTTADRIDRPGEVVDVTDELRPLPPIATVLRGADSKQADTPVHLRATLTEIGTVELYCVSEVSKEQWRLEFSVRGDGGGEPVAITESLPSGFAGAAELVERVYGHKPLPLGPKDVKQLGRALEKAIGPREGWRLPLLRELWSAAYAGAAKRRRSADHERVFYQLAGYALRPGFGYPLDGWRCEQMAGLFKDGVQFHGEKPVWIEFWVMWRRIAGGLPAAAQESIWEYLRPHLSRRVPPHPPKTKEKLKGVVPEGLDEMVRAAASLEHLSPPQKVELGEWIVERLKDPQTTGGPWAWALGRLGARVPVYGSGHNSVDQERAEGWARLLIEAGLSRHDGAPFALAQLARRTGDRTRDLEEGVREACAAALKDAKAPPHWVTLVEEVSSLAQADEARALGDALPPGLTLS